MAFPLSLSCPLYTHGGPLLFLSAPLPLALFLSLNFTQTFSHSPFRLSVCVCLFFLWASSVRLCCPDALERGSVCQWLSVCVGHILPELSQSHHPLLSSTPSPLSVRQSPHIHAPGIHSLKLGKYLGGKAISTFHLNHAANSGLCAFVVYLQTLQLLCRNKAVDSLVIVCRWSTDTFWLKDNQRRVDMLRTLLSIYRCVLFQH